MRPLDINFVQRMSAGQWALRFGLLLMLALVVREGWLLLEQRARNVQLSAEMFEVQMELVRLATPVPRASAPTYAPDAERIHRMASRDLAGVLASLENLRIPGVKISSLTWEAATGLAQVELDAQDMAQVLECVKTLNEGDPSPKWSVGRVASGGNGDTAMRASLSGQW